MVIKNPYFIFLLLCFVSCSKRNPYEKLHGFWVSREYKANRPFNTLTIRDSVVELNKYSPHNYVLPIEYKDDHFKAIYPFDSWETAFLIHTQGDSLLQIFPHSVNDTIIYTKMDSTSIFRDALLSDVLPRVNLPEANQETGNIILHKKSLVANIYIGRLKPGVLEDVPTITEDSVVLQVNDVLINLMELNQFLKLQQSQLDESERDRLMVVLYADKDTSEEMLYEVKQAIQLVSPKLTVCKAFIDWDSRKLCYENI